MAKRLKKKKKKKVKFTTNTHTLLSFLPIGFFFFFLLRFLFFFSFQHFHLSILLSELFVIFVYTDRFLSLKDLPCHPVRMRPHKRQESVISSPSVESDVTDFPTYSPMQHISTSNIPPGLSFGTATSSYQPPQPPVATAVSHPQPSGRRSSTKAQTQAPISKYISNHTCNFLNPF